MFQGGSRLECSIKNETMERWRRVMGEESIPSRTKSRVNRSIWSTVIWILMIRSVWDMKSFVPDPEHTERNKRSQHRNSSKILSKNVVWASDYDYDYDNLSENHETAPRVPLEVPAINSVINRTRMDLAAKMAFARWWNLEAEDVRSTRISHPFHFERTRMVFS